MVTSSILRYGRRHAGLGDREREGDGEPFLPEVMSTVSCSQILSDGMLFDVDVGPVDGLQADGFGNDVVAPGLVPGLAISRETSDDDELF